MKTTDASKNLLGKHNDLRLVVVDYNTVKKNGDVLLGPGVTLFGYLSYFSVIRKHSREGCLKLAQKVTQEFKYDVE